MPPAAVVAFGAGLLFVGYVLAGYPLLLAVMAWGRDRTIRRSPRIDTVSVLLPVHNGERWIERKLDTLARLDYPHDRMELIIVDDGSTDRTVELVRGADLPMRVRVISMPRSGKAVALNAAMAAASGDVLFFTDVRQELEPASLRQLVSGLADPEVGVVSGELVILSGETQEEADIGLYWRYEKWIRRRLSRLDSVMGATGCIYAMKRRLATTLPASTILDDVYLPLGAFFQGFRVVFDETAKAFDYPTALGSEFGRKVRTQAGVYQLLGLYPRLLVPSTRMWLHFMSHKVGRLLLPFALLLIAVSSAGLPAPWRGIVVAAQVVFYGLAFVDPWVPVIPLIKRISSLARTFVVLVGAALCAPVHLLRLRDAQGGWAATQVREPRSAARPPQP